MVIQLWLCTYDHLLMVIRYCLFNASYALMVIHLWLCTNGYPLMVIDKW